MPTGKPAKYLTLLGGTAGAGKALYDRYKMHLPQEEINRRS